MGRHVSWFAGGMGLALVAAVLWVGPTLGQDAKPPSCPVGLVDLRQVFEKLPAFQEQLEVLKREVEGREKEYKQRTKEFAQKVGEHKKLPPAQQPANEEALGKEQRALEGWLTEQKAAFIKKEAAIYEAHLRMVTDEIARQAQRKGIALVLRTNETASGEEVEPQQRAPAEVLRALNKPVLYHREELDLTNAVIAGLTGQ